MNPSKFAWKEWRLGVCQAPVLFADASECLPRWELQQRRKWKTNGG